MTLYRIRNIPKYDQNSKPQKGLQENKPRYTPLLATFFYRRV